MDYHGVKYILKVKKMQFIVRNSCIFLAFVFVFFSVSAEIYKWIDEEGKVHYGEKPPISKQDTNIKTIKIRDNVDTESARNILRKKTKDLDERNENRREEKTNQIEAQVKLEKNKALCKQAKKNLENFQHPRVTIEQDDGTMRTLGEEERQSGIVEAKDIVKRVCNY